MNIEKEMLPKHLAIIMDGNGRWAKQQGKQRIFGHEKERKQSGRLYKKSPSWVFLT